MVSLKRQGTFAVDEETALLKKPEQQSRSAVWVQLWRVFLCTAWIAAGVAAACYFEGWSPLEGLYVIVQIVTTVGYGDITVTSEAAKVFMGLYVVVTVMLIGTLITDLMDQFVKTNQDALRKKLREVQQSMNQDIKSEDEAANKFGKYNELLTAFVIFLFFVLAGTVFYATYESCSCSHGVTAIEGCVPEKCAATGGAEKSWIDAGYMALVTLTTVGFGDHSPKSPVGRWFGCLWMLLGVAATANFVSSFSQLILAEEKEQKRLDRVSRELFNKIDKNNDGTLSRLEFRTYALIKFGLVSEEDLDEIDKLFTAIDKDKSGALTYSEIMEHCDC